MFRGLYTAYTGMVTQQQKMDGISNNLANVDTTGYKKDQMIQASFDEILAYKIHDPEVPQGKSIGKMSLGVKVSQVYTDFGQGSMKQTDNLLDVALQGDGFFKVGEVNDQGTMAIKYTRDGSFNFSQNGQLVTKDGLFVLGTDDAPIELDNDNFRINEDGSIYQNEVRMNQLQIVNFEEAQTLRKQGSSLYEVTDTSVTAAFEGTVVQGFLESSNVNTINEMVDMIATTRTYEANQKMIQTYDATMDKVVNSVGSL